MLKAAVVVPLMLTPVHGLQLQAMRAPSWTTLPRFFHSTNASGLWNEQALASIVRFDLVTLDKGSGAKNATDTRYEEYRALEAAAGIKVAAAQAGYLDTVHIMYYFNSIMDWTQYELHQHLLNHMEYALHDAQGKPALMDVGGKQELFMFGVDQPATRTWWIDAVARELSVNVTLPNGDTRPIFDGMFMDRANNYSEWPPFSPLPPAAYSRLWTGHDLLLHETTARLERMGDFFIANNRIAPGLKASMMEDFGASETCIRYLQRADSLGVLVEAHAGDRTGGSDNFCANITNSLAAFLIGAGVRAYYACAIGYQTDPRWPAVSDWWLDVRPEYSKPLGLPLGPGVKQGTLWSRSFATGTNVTFDASSNVGAIYWSDGTTQEGTPVPPPSPPDLQPCIRTTVT